MQPEESANHLWINLRFKTHRAETMTIIRNLQE